VAPLGYAPSLTSNVRLGWKWRTVTNTTAYYVTELISAAKKFCGSVGSFPDSRLVKVIGCSHAQKSRCWPTKTFVVGAATIPQRDIDSNDISPTVTHFFQVLRGRLDWNY
jgi:hypothetical protein